MSNTRGAVIGVVLLCVGLGVGYLLAPSGVPYAEYQELEAQLVFETDAYENTISGYEEDLEKAETKAQRDQDALEAKNVDYDFLMDENEILEESYIEDRLMVDEYNLLTNNMTLLQKKYDSLEVLYIEMGENYLRSIPYEWYWGWVFDMTSMETVTPRLERVYDWLRADRTDKIDYSENFDCNQYAASLTLNAKQEDWNMGIIAVWGNDSTLGEDYAHAFNFIITQEGLVYIEPQTDSVWWYTDYTRLTVNTTANINGDIIKIRKISIFVGDN